ncbi:hypothetical protein F0562_023304 [Nyssa sinensis]|uniref:C3H1-type domain-containing protein n=1 Tax=Nyssa sinensis TaxID=561372 RepID=A0A5J5BKB8_9ASTE|nr:hypothetical protein F0562_023304 [Nyssa sinensis]
MDLARGDALEMSVELRMSLEFASEESDELKDTAYKQVGVPWLPPIRALTFDVLGLVKVIEARSKQGGVPKVVERCGGPDSSRCVLAASINDHKTDPAMGGMRSGEGEYPKQVGQPECLYYMKIGVCRLGPSCKYYHPRVGEGGGSVGPVALNIFGRRPHYMKT